MVRGELLHHDYTACYLMLLLRKHLWFGPFGGQWKQVVSSLKLISTSIGDMFPTTWQMEVPYSLSFVSLFGLCQLLRKEFDAPCSPASNKLYSGLFF